MRTRSTANEPAKQAPRVYVLRLWQAEAPDPGWRASLEDPSSRDRIGFSSLEQLFAFLMEQVERAGKEQT